MKRRLSGLVLTLILAQSAYSQELDAPKPVSFGISAGPAFLRFDSEAYLPALSWQVAFLGISHFRKIDLQTSVQYFPVGTTFKGKEGYAKFMNHLLSISSMVKLGAHRKLSIDLGASFAVPVAYSDTYTYPEPNPLICYFGVLGEPVRIKQQLFLQAGTTVKLSARHSISLTGMASTLGSRDYRVPYTYIIQGSFSHLF